MESFTFPIGLNDVYQIVIILSH